jgi:GT2 family glycosyltransferase
MFDIVTVYHTQPAMEDAARLYSEVERHCSLPFTFITVDNRIDNRGFARGCNVGVSQGGHAYIGLLNPDCHVKGDPLQPVVDAFRDPVIVITGERFEKQETEVRAWGCTDWVCGAAFFVRRSFWERVGGFDERYVWAWEETDMIRRAEQMGYRAKSIRLPVEHSSPRDDSEGTSAYKNHWFEHGARVFRDTWR